MNKNIKKIHEYFDDIFEEKLKLNIILGKIPLDVQLKAIDSVTKKYSKTKQLAIEFLKGAGIIK